MPEKNRGTNYCGKFYGLISVLAFSRNGADRLDEKSLPFRHETINPEIAKTFVTPETKFEMMLKIYCQ
jgi:hypothetical protein